MSESNGNLSILTNLFTAPQAAFEGIIRESPILLPMLTIIAINAILVVFLYTNIDYPWFVDHMVELQAGDLSKAEQNQVRQGMEMMSPRVMGGVGAFSVAAVLCVIFCLEALYFLIVSNIAGDGFRFKQWLALVSWTAMPSLLGSLAAFVNILSSSNGQIAPESLNPLSLNELFFNLQATQGIGAILASVDITLFWTLALMVMGYAKWTQRSLIKSSLIVLTPFVVIFGIRFLLA